MTVILGIDAAWTNKEPSGVALVAGKSAKWKCLCVAPSYDSFVSRSENVPVNWNAGRFIGSTPQDPSLLAAAKEIAGTDVDLVTIDMPIATFPFSSRRSADDAISTAFGRFGCATHSPSSKRPGRLSTDIMTQLNYAGYPLATTAHSSGTLRRTIEVYPHPALLRLLNCQYRVPYKFAKSLRYWLGLDIRDRIGRILDEFKRIERALSDTFGCTRLIIPYPGAPPLLMPYLKEAA